MGFIEAIIPTILAMIIFWIGLRAVIQADRRERAAQARFEAHQRLQERAADEADAASASLPAGEENSGQADATAAAKSSAAGQSRA